MGGGGGEGFTLLQQICLCLEPGLSTFLRFDCSRKWFNNILGSKHTALAKKLPYSSPIYAFPRRAACNCNL